MSGAISKHFVRFFSPGTFMSETTDREIESWDVEEAIRLSRSVLERHAALAAAAERGVRVRVWREASTAGFGDGDPARTLAAAGAAVRAKPPGPLMHLKSYCVDGALLRSGAANFSASGEKRQDNDLIVIRGPGACDGFAADFARMWGGETPHAP